jgi:hypothetical protein
MPFGLKPNRSSVAFYWMPTRTFGGNDMLNIIRAIARFFTPRPDDFGARLTSHYGFDA